MSKTSFGKMTPGRPSDQRAKLMEALRDEAEAPALRRVNFQVNDERHRKLKMEAARQGKSIKDLLTAFIDSLPDPTTNE